MTLIFTVRNEPSSGFTRQEPGFIFTPVINDHDAIHIMTTL